MFDIKVIDKAVLVSIKPEWVCEILNGKKTIEIRKNFPNLKPPFKVYIYCTSGSKKLNYLRTDSKKTRNYWLDNKAFGYNVASCNGKVVAEFICDTILEFERDEYGANCYDIDDDSFEAACITLMSDYWDYGKGKTLYGWHISDLKIYSEPAYLNDFAQTKVINTKKNGNNNFIEKLLNTKSIEVKHLNRPPQSWCYVNKRRGLV